MNSRLGVRISKEIRAELELIIESGSFGSLSELVRQAIESFLTEHREDQLEGRGLS